MGRAATVFLIKKQATNSHYVVLISASYHYMLGSALMDSKAKPFRILILSGGGYRGLFTAKVLADIEHHTERAIRDHFDLIVGTSIGGIIALSVADGIAASKLVDLFVDHGEAIFKKRRSGRRIFRSPYTQDALKDQLIKNFADRTLGHLNKRVLIPTINYSTGLPQIFKTPHHKTFRSDHVHKLVDVALATSAAPAFFPRHCFNDSQYVDGGLYANNPGLLALHEAEYFLKVPTENIHALSIGTMSSRYTVDPTQIKNGGLLDWGRLQPKGWYRNLLQFFKFADAPESIIGLGISVQESLTEKILEHKLGGRYEVIDSQLSHYSNEAVGLAKADVYADEVLLSHANAESKKFVGKSNFPNFKQHAAPQAEFFYGVNANAQPEVLANA